MLVVVVLLGFFSIASLFVYLTVLDAGRWRKKIETALLPLGFSVCPSKDEKAALVQRLLIVNPRHQGKRLLMHLYRRPSPDGRYDLFFCDYRFASASGKAWGRKWLLVCLVSTELDLPRFSLDTIPEIPSFIGNLFHGLSETFPMPGMELLKTGDSAHGEHFRVYAAAGQAKQVLSLIEGIGPTLHLRGGVNLDAQGDSLILSSIEMGADLVRHELDSQKLLGLINVTLGLYETIRQQPRV